MIGPLRSVNGLPQLLVPLSEQYIFAVRYEQVAGELRTALEMRSSRQAVHRSMELLKTTDGLVSGIGNHSQGEKQAPA